MAKEQRDEREGQGLSEEKKLEQLYELIDGIEAAMLTLYAPDWKAWLGDEGGERDGGPDDPRIALVEVTADSATYLKSTHSRPVALFQVAKAIVTGTPPKAGDLGHLDRGTLAQGGARKE